MTKKYTSLHGFDNDAIHDAIIQEIPVLLDVIHNMHAHLMTASGAEFWFKDDHPEMNLEYDQYADKELENRAYLEIIRALESLFTQCVKRGHEPNEPASLSPHQLNPEYAEYWFKECLDPSVDERERRYYELWDKYSHLPWDDALKAVMAELENKQD